jgi:uncharacterized protein (DUF779 family)
MYTISVANNKLLKIVKADTGVIINHIQVRSGELDGSPIVLGDRCTFIVKDGDQRIGMIYKIPSGTFLTNFRT